MKYGLLVGCHQGLKEKDISYIHQVILNLSKKLTSEKNIRNIRSNILNLTFKAKSSHIGSCLSIVEILVALYFGVLKKMIDLYKQGSCCFSIILNSF